VKPIDTFPAQVFMVRFDVKKATRELLDKALEHYAPTKKDGNQPRSKERGFAADLNRGARSGYRFPVLRSLR
jgi:hypothetical protein